MSAPTNGWPVVNAAVEGEAGGGAQSAPESAADQEIARRQRELGPAPVSIIAFTTSAGFT